MKGVKMVLVNWHAQVTLLQAHPHPHPQPPLHVLHVHRLHPLRQTQPRYPHLKIGQQILQLVHVLQQQANLLRKQHKQEVHWSFRRVIQLKTVKVSILNTSKLDSIQRVNLLLTRPLLHNVNTFILTKYYLVIVSWWRAWIMRLTFTLPWNWCDLHSKKRWLKIYNFQYVSNLVALLVLGVRLQIESST